MGTSSRRWLVALAIACFIGAFALTPSEVRSRLGSRLAAPPPLPTSGADRVVTVPPNGDPFAPRVIDAPDGAHPFANVDAAVLPASHIGPLPANAGAGPSPLDLVAGSSARVSAVILGSRPAAIVLDGPSTHLVEIGDRVDDATVQRIDADGVTLSNLRRLRLSSPEGNER